MINGMSGYNANGWVAAVEEMPLIGRDVLIYSVDARGYGVGVTRFTAKGVLWFYSTTGQEFQPAPSHWKTLPEPPVEKSQAFVSYSSQN